LVRRLEELCRSLGDLWKNCGNSIVCAGDLLYSRFTPNTT
jgi:hypothetical protein